MGVVVGGRLVKWVVTQGRVCGVGSGWWVVGDGCMGGGRG